MKLLEELGINSKEPFLCLLGSEANIGKTTALAIIASEFVNNGKNVLFISEINARATAKKFTNLVLTDKGKLVIKNIPIIEKSLSEIINIKEFTHVFIDSPIVSVKNLSFLSEARTLVNEGLTIIISNQLRKIIPVDDLVLKYPHVKGLLISDYVITLSKEVNFTFFEKLKNLFKKNVPNITLILGKNRYGDKKTIKKFIDFKLINK